MMVYYNFKHEILKKPNLWTVPEEVPLNLSNPVTHFSEEVYLVI